jgi:hypothetical protein
MTVTQIAQQLQTELSGFRREVNLVYENIVLPGWGGDLHGMPRTLYGYMMATFSYVDLVSLYRYGAREGQTKRMRQLVVDYMNATTDAAAVCVQMWRHILMHTANPRVLTEARLGKAYRWLLHWGPDHLPKDQHLHLQPDGRVLNVGLIYLLEDVTTTGNKVFAEAIGHIKRESIVLNAQRDLDNKRFTL